jgi:serine/threonine protein kinase/WD40 repeat protein
MSFDTTCLHCGTTNPAGSNACRVCGSPLEASVFLPSGTRIGHYELLEVLGRGGFGITYKAKDFATGEIVALKELFPDGLATRDRDGTVRVPGAALEEFEQSKNRFALEAQLLQRVSHGATTHFVALFAANDTLYLAMEFVQGETLEARLARGAKFSMKEARNALRDVLDVLETAHDAGLLHRDIKPGNIILKPGGAELIDFGSGVRFERDRTMKISQRLLTPEYAPLELYGQNVRLSPASDLYSLAATFYEAISGVRPPSALERANGAKLESLRKRRPDISKSFAKAIDAALELRVDARPQSVNEMRALLNAPTSSKPSRAKQTPPRAASSIPSARSPGAPRASNTPANPVLIQQSALRDNAIFTGAICVLIVVMALGGVLIYLGQTELGQQTLVAAILGLIGGFLVFVVAWWLVQPVRWIAGRAVNASSMSFYRQSMLGVYSFGVVVLFRYSSGNWNGWMSELPTVLAVGYFLVLLGLAFSKRTNPPRALRPWTVVGLHIAIPCLALGWIVNSFGSRFQPESNPAPTTRASSSAPSPTAPVPSRPQAITAPSSSSTTSPKPFTATPITGNKWVCQERRGSPFSETMFDGTFLIGLDDESHAVTTALAPRLNAKALPCSDVANTVPKFTYRDVSLRKDRDKAGEMVWQFVPLLETQLAVYGRWLSNTANVVLITAKPLDGTVEFLERVSYKGNRNFVLVSTSALKPSDYRSSSASRTQLLERVAAVVQQRLAKQPARIESLEELDALWNPSVAATRSPQVLPRELLRRLPSASSVLRLERSYGGSIQVATLSADARFVAAALADGSVRVWNTKDGRERSRFAVSGGVEELAINPSGRFVVVATRKNGVFIRDLERDATRRPAASRFTEVNFSSDGRYLLAVQPTQQTSSVLVFPTVSLQNGRWDVALRFTTDIAEVHASAFNADASYLTLGGAKGEMRVYALQKLLEQSARGERLQGALPLKSHAGRVSDVAFSPDGRWMASADDASGDQGRRVRLWDVNRGFRLVKDMLWGVAVAFSPDSRQLLFSNPDSYRGVEVLDLERLARENQFVSDISNPVFAMGFDAQRRAIGVSSAGIHALDTKLMRETGTLVSTVFSPSQLELDATRDVLWMAHFNSDDLGRLELRDGRYEVRRLNNPADGERLEPERLSLGRDGEVFVFASAGGGGEELLSVRGSSVKRFDYAGWDYQDEILISRDGLWAVGQDRGERFDLRGAKVRASDLQVADGAFSPRLTVFASDTKSLYSLNTDEGFTQWNLETGKVMRRFGNADGISRRASHTHLRLSRDGRFFASGRKNGRVTLWDARTGKRLVDWRELEDEGYDECCYDTTYDLQFSPDGRFLVASTQRGATVFDTASRRAVARFDLGDVTVQAFAFHPVTKRLYVASSDGLIRQYAWR